MCETSGFPGSDITLSLIATTTHIPALPGLPLAAWPGMTTLLMPPLKEEWGGAQMDQLFVVNSC